jgi:hypothetical protein
MKMLPKINIEGLQNASALMPPLNLRDLFDYIVAPPGTIESLKKRDCANGVDLFEGPVFLDPENFTLCGRGGRYPKSNLESPIFCPYVLFMESATFGTSRSALMRVGSFVKTEEVKEKAC